MPNLTTEQKLVKPALDANPLPDHDLVLFRRVGGGGLRFHSILGPDDRLSLVDRIALGSSITAYAVTRDQKLRHKMSVPELKSADHVGPFTLDLTLGLRIAEPQVVVEKLESDPLARLEREAREVLGRVASRMDWSEVQAPACDFEDQLLSSTVMDESGRRVASLAFLQGFAEELGLELKSVQVSRQLPAEVGEATRVRLREQERRIIDEEMQKSAMLSEQLQAQREELLAWKANARAVSTSVTQNLTKVLEQIADKVESAPALRTVMNDLMAMRDEIAMISNVGSREMKVLEGSSGPVRLGAAPAAGLSGLLAQLAALPLEPADRNRLQACLLRLAGEVQGQANPAVMEECFQNLILIVSRVQNIETSDQRDLLVRLQDPDWLRTELARV